MARLIRSAGVEPELEVFDLGHVVLARPMVEQGHLAAPPFLQLFMGVPWRAPATAEAVLAMRAGLPARSLWSAFGISRHQFPTVALAAVLGGHVRVGLEDTFICPAACWRRATRCWWGERRRWCAASARRSRRRHRRGHCSGWGQG